MIIDIKPKISVIIPAYNAQDMICRCMDSVRLQSLQEIEIICVDDGSTDDTALYIKQEIKKDPRIILIHQDNCGAGIARNNAITNARGNYLAFMDADDCYPNRFTLENMFYHAHINALPI